MKVTGFSFIKNAVIYDYTIVEAISSILPICNDFVVAVGKSDDDTLNLIKSIDQKKIKIVETEWDNHLRTGGKVLAQETNKAFASVSKDSDWAFYIQGDEVVHEKYLDTIYDEMQSYKEVMEIDGLLFKYLHFYGSYEYVGEASNWYKHEIRVIKNNKSIYSYKDAMGFRKDNNKKLNVHPINAYIYHYGWVRQPKAMQKKREYFHKIFHNEQSTSQLDSERNEFNYSNLPAGELKKFSGTHPKVMKKKIESLNWKFIVDRKKFKKTAKEEIKLLLYKFFRLDFNYKNYKIKDF